MYAEYTPASALRFVYSDLLPTLCQVAALEEVLNAVTATLHMLLTTSRALYRMDT